MSYSDERKAIEAYFKTQWGQKTPIGFDGQEFTPHADSVRLTINSGARLQGSIGRAANRIDHVGTLIVSIYTDGKKGSEAWRCYTDPIIAFLHEKKLDRKGKIITATADAFLRFSPPGSADQHPYVSASFKDAPLHITNITAPFHRYEYV